MRRFCAKGRLLVPHPLKPRRKGEVAHYVNRKAVQADDGRTAFPAVSEPLEYDEGRPELRDMDRRLTKRVRRDGDLWPYDRETAAACGVPFVPVTFNDGEWVASSNIKPAAKSAAAKKATD